MSSTITFSRSINCFMSNCETPTSSYNQCGLINISLIWWTSIIIFYVVVHQINWAASRSSCSLNCVWSAALTSYIEGIRANLLATDGACLRKNNYVQIGIYWKFPWMIVKSKYTHGQKYCIFYFAFVLYACLNFMWIIQWLKWEGMRMRNILSQELSL